MATLTRHKTLSPAQGISWVQVFNIIHTPQYILSLISPSVNTSLTPRLIQMVFLRRVELPGPPARSNSCYYVNEVIFLYFINKVLWTHSVAQRSNQISPRVSSHVWTGIHKSTSIDVIKNPCISKARSCGYTNLVILSLMSCFIRFKPD